MKRGFSLLELLVASLLFSMIVILLSTMMNQSAIAWRAGSASVVELGEAHQKFTNWQAEADNVLPRLDGDKRWMVAAPWDKYGKIRNRAFVKPDWLVTTINRPDLSGWTVQKKTNGGSGSSSCIVGVTSAGPDRAFDTDDDITSWMGDVE